MKGGIRAGGRNRRTVRRVGNRVITPSHVCGPSTHVAMATGSARRPPMDEAGQDRAAAICSVPLTQVRRKSRLRRRCNGRILPMHDPIPGNNRGARQPWNGALKQVTIDEQPGVPLRGGEAVEDQRVHGGHPRSRPNTSARANRRQRPPLPGVSLPHFEQNRSAIIISIKSEPRSDRRLPGKGDLRHRTLKRV